MDHVDITAIVVAKNESNLIRSCLTCLQWCAQILVIDHGSVDDTAVVAESLGAKVIPISSTSFAKLRTEALKHVTTSWVIYIDPDERVTPLLAKEIAVNLETQTSTVFTLNRRNYHYGALMQAGGWQHDQVTRIFLVSAITEWTGNIHESPVYSGTSLTLQTPLEHFSHRSISQGLKKSAEWTLMEAELLAAAPIPPVTRLTILRKGWMEFFRRYWQFKGYRDGMPGFIESLTQGINKALVYMQVWELQQKPAIPTQYQHLEKQIDKLWKEGR